MTVKVGHVHNWRYRSQWQEKKVRPGLWLFNSKQIKVRAGRQFSRLQGAPVGTVFTWGIRGVQRLVKVSANQYAGRMTGQKTFLKRRSR